MTFHCDGCDLDLSNLDLKRCVIPNKGELLRLCRHCVGGTVAVPDVFFDGKPEVTLADDPKTGKPIVFGSKGEKAKYLRERGLQEGGDRVRGSYASYTAQPKPVVDSKKAVREAMQKVRGMGAFNRRQEMYRIQQEARRATR